MEALTEEFIIYLGCTENFVTKHYNFVGCDGCLNWKGMGFGYSGFPGGTDYLVKDYYPEDKLTFGNNNGLQVFRNIKFTKFLKGRLSSCIFHAILNNF